MSTTNTTPCCGSEWCDDKHPVMWNPHNRVIQCHACGQVWQPSFFCDIEGVRNLIGELMWTENLQPDITEFLKKFPHLRP